MTTEEDLLAEAYFKEYGGDLEDLDADAEEALLRLSEEEDENEQTPVAKEASEDENIEESIEYVNEDGDPIFPSDYQGVEYVEYSDTDRGHEGYESGNNEEEGDDVLELVVDADLEFDDGVVQENVSVDETAARSSKQSETVVSSVSTTAVTNRRKIQPVVVNKGEEKQQQQQARPSSDVSALSRRDDEYYREQIEERKTRVESSDSDDEEERMGRGRFHSERSNIIQLTTNKQRTNIPDTLDGVLQPGNDTNRSDFGRNRRNRGRDNSRTDRRDRDRDRGSRDSHRQPPSQQSVAVRSESSPRNSQRSDSATRADNREPVTSSQMTVDSRGSRKILINPHFKGSSAQGSSWLGDTPPKNEYAREPLIANIPEISSQHHHLHQQQQQPQQHVTHNVNPMQPMLVPASNQGQQHIVEHRPPPFSYELSQPSSSEPPSYPNSFSAPSLPNFQPRLPVPPVTNRLPSDIVHNALGPPLNVYSQRDMLTQMPIVQSQPWLQHVPHPTIGQPIQMQEIQNCNQWSNSHPPISQLNTQLNLLPPNHSTPQPRWPHSAPSIFPTQPAPQISVPNLPPPYVDQRLAPLPDVRRPPPNHMNQLPQTYNALPPPPVFRMDAPPPINRNAPIWQNQPNRMPSKPLLNSARPPLFDHPPPPLLDLLAPPPLLGNMPSKYPPTSIAPQMQRERQQPMSAQFNLMNNNLLDVPTHHHQQQQQPRASLLPSAQNVTRSGQQQKQWSSSNITRQQRVPNTSKQLQGKRPSLSQDVKPQKIQKTYDKQIAWRNTNIKEVKLVENLPSAAAYNVASNSSKPQVKAEPEDAVVEDEETRRYRAQIELQKKKREEIMRMKEQRRQSMALERRKELMERKKIEQQQQGVSNAIVNDDNVSAISNVAKELPKAQGPKQRVVAGSGSVQQTPTQQQNVVVVKKRVVVLRNIASISSQTVQQSNVQVQGAQKTQNVVGNVRVGKPKPQVQVVSPQVVKKTVQHVVKTPAATAIVTQQAAGGGDNDGSKSIALNSGVSPKRVIVAPKSGLMTVMKRVQPMQGGNAVKQQTVQRRAVIGNKQTISTNQPQRTVVLNTNVAGQPPRVVQQAKGASSGNQQTQRHIVTSVPGPASVLIENLALATNEVSVRKLCQSVGQVESVNVYRDQRKAVVTFKSQEHAYIFMEKYQRRMVDLSLISISMIG